MNFKTLKTEFRDNVLHCWLHRPEKRNALNTEMLNELIQLFGDLYIGDKVAVLVLRGWGKVFSAGADLSGMSDISGKSEIELKNEAGLFYDCFDALYRLHIPTICYVHGGIHGGANGLPAACDYTLADSGALFSFGEVGLGLVPATVAPFVVRRTGVIKAKRMMLGGYTFGAEEALNSGLIDFITNEEEEEKKISEIAGQILSNAPGALSATKKLLIEIEEKPDTEKLKELCTGLIARARISDEAKEGIGAFFEKRKPSWQTKSR